MTEASSSEVEANADAKAVKGPPPTAVRLREELTKLVVADLLGPKGGDEEEVDESRVSDRYVLGMLAPKRQGQAQEAAQDEELAAAGAGRADDGQTEPSTPPADTMFPSSLGLTFTVAEGVKELSVEASWGRYEKTDSEELENEDGEPKKVWKRWPMGGRFTVSLTTGPITPLLPDPDAPEVEVQGLVRKRERHWVVTLFLVNGQTEPETLKDSSWIFQTALRVEGDPKRTVFVKRPYIHETGGWDPEILRETRELEMSYRKRIEYASGHGVAVHAELDPQDRERVRWVETRVVPRHEIEQQTPPTAEDPGFEGLAGLELDMAVLGEMERGQFEQALAPLTDTYSTWIANEREKIERPKEGLSSYADVAAQALDRCERARSRIREGIARIAGDERLAEAFRFANRAMAQQRVHSIYAEQRRRGEEADLAAIEAEPRNHSWRPFQLAFVLLNLQSTAQLDHPDRSHESEAVADLLWFPTGGGKTEAYLGLAAFVLALRRLEGEVEGRSGEHGVAVIMRYTLRLLTLQQFQRAAALICACEVIRREDEAKWGKNPFRIGLWVGAKATPNNIDDAANWLSQQRNAHGYHDGDGGSSPAQLPHCPWCGSRIDPGKDIEAEPPNKGRGRVLTYCGDRQSRCTFTRGRSAGEGLPVVVVDEELYRLLPSLIIATADKFAQMPWNGMTQMLFGQVDGDCPRHGFRSPDVDDAMRHPKKGSFPAVRSVPAGPLRPPDLIIQDELHLISGPLGSMAGLYETAVDELCSWEVGGKRVRPKVIASTATIRNAAAQVNGLFMRRVEVFPPAGTSVDDNFFSVQRTPSEDDPGRLYLGICAPGKRLKAVLIRVYMAYLGAGQSLYDRYGVAADPWMTLLGYFNSIRELAGMRRLVEDDVRQRMRKIGEFRGLGNRRLGPPEELTSRKSSSDIPEILDRLEVVFDPVDEAVRRQERKEGKRLSKPWPYDAVLATNMVSVGVDVKRLGLMVVAGQPKTTAEYIQATSRVGRHHPGVVCTVYNWARPRDLSHYERFEHYHATFYERVESLSVTPFAPRAIDRGLTALLVALVRLRGQDLNGNDRASEFDRDHPNVARAIEAIAQRAEGATGRHDVGARVRDQLARRVDDWLARGAAGSGGNLAYKGKRDGTTVPLLEQPSDVGWDTFTCLNSLRDVEPMSNFILVDDPTRFRRPAGGGGDEG
jgi:hypothetical protein